MIWTQDFGAQGINDRVVDRQLLEFLAMLLGNFWLTKITRVCAHTAWWTKRLSICGSTAGGMTEPAR